MNFSNEILCPKDVPEQIFKDTMGILEGHEYGIYYDKDKDVYVADYLLHEENIKDVDDCDYMKGFTKVVVLAYNLMFGGFDIDKDEDNENEKKRLNELSDRMWNYIVEKGDGKDVLICST